MKRKIMHILITFMILIEALYLISCVNKTKTNSNSYTDKSTITEITEQTITARKSSSIKVSSDSDVLSSGTFSTTTYNTQPVDEEIKGPFKSGFIKKGNRFEYPNQVLQAFDYSGVVLLNSPIYKQYQNTLEFYLNIPNDDILHTIRLRAEVNAPGKPMGGWYDGGSAFAGSTFGQWLSAFARFYAATGDIRIKQKAQYLMNEWGKLIENNGFFYFNPTKSANTWHYTYDKMVLGLTDMYVYMQDNNARTYLNKITDFAEKYLAQFKALPTSKNIVGEKASGVGDNEWYTLSENLYRAYLATGDNKYKRFAEVWHYDPFWDALRNKKNSYWNGLHAYSHVNCVGGAALLYMVTGQSKYKQTITGFYDSFSEWEFMSNGAFGIGEGLRGNSNTMAEAARKYPYSFETPCCSWATFKLSRYLIGTTGEARYGDWVEKVLYNGIFAALPMKDTASKRGQTFYYANYTQNNATKTYYDSPWPCCSGTYALAVSDYVNQIYYKNDKELYVNLFVPSKVTEKYNGKSVTLKQTTSYPQSDTVQFEIFTASSAKFNLKIRLPQWVDGNVKVTVNGGTRSIDKTGDWLYLGSSWKNGDKISVKIPLEVKRGYFDPKTSNVACFMYGPVMLAAEENADAIVTLDTSKKVSGYFTPNKDTFGFVFKDELGTSRKMVPFYAVPADKEYCVNFDVIE